MIKKILKNIFGKQSYEDLDKSFLKIDKSQILRTKNLSYIPNFKNRKGGKISYAEWAHVIGLFQSLFYFTLQKKENNKILDIGSGMGLLGMASMPFVKPNGTYLGLDVIKSNIDYCLENFDEDNLKFTHFDFNNQKYAHEQKNQLKPWDLKNDEFDLVTALSVWTHLNEEHAIYYFKEIDRVLTKSGKAIITFFYLDDYYYDNLNARQNKQGRFHNTNQMRWIFDNKAYGSDNWFAPKWVKVPEDAIAVNKKGLELMLENTSLKMVGYYSGNWKEQSGFYFQDVMVFQKQ